MIGPDTFITTLYTTYSLPFLFILGRERGANPAKHYFLLWEMRTVLFEQGHERELEAVYT